MEAAIFSFWAQGFFCVVALVLNSTLALVIYKSNRKNFGFYNWLLIGYCFFEIIYAVVVLQAMPIHVVYEHTWIFFSFRGPLIGTSVAFLSSASYCFFYEVWMGCVVMNFIYRYVVVCRQDWADAIKQKRWCRWFLLCMFLTFILICIVCTTYVCAINKISPAMETKIQNEFKIEKIKDIGYTMLRLFDLQGNVSVSGILATVTHFAVVAASVSTITFCSIKIWIRIKEMQKMRNGSNIKMEKQLFRTLLIQIIVPVLLCHVPSAAHLTFAFWQDFPLDFLTPFFSVFTTIPKALDPIIAFACIAEYRNTLRRLLGYPGSKNYVGTVTNMTQTHSQNRLQRELSAI